MPFTFAHPSIILPLRHLNQRLYSLTGLIIGSMAPDFEYFVRMKVQSTYSHTIAGIFWFDLPLGIVLAFLYHNIARNSLIQNLPGVIRKHLIGFTRFDWTNAFHKNWPVILLSIIVGASSHLLWDAFTHSTGYFVTHMHFLQTNIFVTGHSFPVFKLLQHASTLIGLSVILFFLLGLPSEHDPVSINTNKYYWLIVMSITTFILIIRMVALHRIGNYGDLIVSVITGTIVAIILTPILLRKKVKRCDNLY